MEPIGAEIRAEAGRHGAPEGITRFTDCWLEAVGAEIARHAWPAAVQRDGTLVVHVRDSIWGFELTQRAAEIAVRLPGRPPLKFVPGPLPDLAAAPRPAPPQASPELSREAAALAAPITDEKLREAVVKTIKAALLRPPDDRSV